MSLGEPGEGPGPSTSSGKRRRRPIINVAGPSSGETLTSPVKKRKPTTLSVVEQEITINVYTYVKNTWPEDVYPSNVKMVEKVSEISGVSKSTIYRVLSVYRDSDKIPEKGIINKIKKSVIDQLDDFHKSAIRVKVHHFIIAGELPTFDKILLSINQDDQSEKNFPVTCVAI
ncbi:unnamed protein product [Parnassius apollo]|uniref:(apollo) hypothetical protein n=1 Tax=Parnassius apollo TaxID=110799 RepID=A0A8S3X2Z6_PARAO|nr:unnamed protein product [Parnassius apollo]